MKKPLITLAAVIAVGSAAFLIVAGDDDVQAPESQPSMQQPMGMDALTDADTDASTAAVAGSGLPEALFRSVVEDEVDEPIAGTRDLRIRVILADGLTAAAGAEVRVLDDPARSEADWSRSKGEAPVHWSEITEDEGVQFRADSQGMVLLPSMRGAVMVVAKSGDQFGCRQVGKDLQEAEVTLQQDEVVRVRVVDEQGVPAEGVPVGLVQRPSDPSGSSHVDGVQQLERYMREIELKVQQGADPAKARYQGAAARKEIEQGVQNLRVEHSGDMGQWRVASGLSNQASDGSLVLARRQTDAMGMAEFRHFQLARADASRKPWRTNGPVSFGPAGPAVLSRKVVDGSTLELQRLKDGSMKMSVGKTPGQQKQDASVPAQVFEAAVLLPTQKAVAERFELGNLPKDPIELRLPPTASLTLRTVDRDGRPFTHPVHVDLFAADHESDSFLRVSGKKPQDEVELHFPRVGLGLMLTARCRLDDDDFSWQMAPAPGPGIPGDHIQVDLVVAPEVGMLHGRVVDAGGQPLSASKLTFLITSRVGRLEGEELRVDREGRFHLPYKVASQHAAPFRLEVRRGEVVPTTGHVRALVQLPEAYVTDLGDVRVDRFAELAHGTVVDDRGQPIAGASLRLQGRRPAGRDGEMRFVDEAFVQTKSDQAGEFALFGDTGPGEFRLHAAAEGHFSADEVLGRPGQRMQVELPRLSRVVGTVLLPEWLNAKDVQVALRPSAGDSAARPLQEQRLREYKGRVYAAFDRVREGSYDVSFRCQAFPEPFLTVRGVQIEPGQMDVHPLLQDLDLAAYIYRFEVTAVDENGQVIDPQQPLLVRIVRPDQSSGHVGIPIKRGTAEILSAAPQLEVLPVAVGYAADPVVLSAGPSQVVYRAIPPVEIVLPGLRALVGEVPTFVRLQPKAVDGLPEQLESFDSMSRRIAGWFARARTGQAELEIDDTARIAVLCGGTYDAVLQLGKGRGAHRIPLDTFQVVLRPGAGAPRFVAGYDETLLQMALQSIAGQQTSGR
jgi:hypothetical protein